MSITDLFNLWGIWQRAQQHQALTPSERAWLQGMQVAWHGVWPIALATLLAGALTWVEAGTPFQWTTLGALVVSALTAGKIAWSQARAKVVSAQSPAEQSVTTLLSGDAGAPPSDRPSAAAPAGPTIPISPMLLPVPLPRSQRTA